MYTVGKLDKEIYSCITDDISVDEVIITDKTNSAIKERHPNDYERFAEFFPQIIADPDYILEANKPNTGICIKTNQENKCEISIDIKIKNIDRL